MIINQLERLMRDFLCGSCVDKRKIHWVGWQVVCRLVEQGGLGMHPLQITNTAFLNKWLWRFGVKKDKVWRRLVAAKYRGLNDWTSRNPEEARGCGVLKY